ncbi:hypothetical protein RSSM_00053 [Rhodopirellula sallentina SM41]|uniref:Uncharacterized protein n=1 Tax=Rhodopirellula sallentina SM41 TaxID=1263870 RepID=M5UKY8_9BACT|nr:hypothetical protein RSSM_00053 [Rhodopirellula sallentina SM41]
MWEDPMAWTVRRLRTTLGFALILMVIQSGSAVSRKDVADPNGSTTESRQVETAEISKASHATANAAQMTSDDMRSAQSAPRAVPPRGWRRTSNGWEHVSTWSTLPTRTVTLNDHIIAQRDAEPIWLRNAARVLRGIHPSYFALGQILAAGTLFVLSRRRGDQRCPHPGRYFFREPTRLAR